MKAKKIKGVTLQVPLFIFSAVVLLLGTAASSMTVAQAALLAPEDHWKYNVQWVWKASIRKTVGIINAQIVVANETADKIQGYIADVNGTQLTMYNREQIVMVRYVPENGRGSDWLIGPRPVNGSFTIDIPEKFRDVETIALFIGSNSYQVDDGTFPQPLVLISSARLDFQTDPTLGEETTIAEEQPVMQKYSENSLIDRILREFYSLSVRSADSGK